MLQPSGSNRERPDYICDEDVHKILQEEKDALDSTQHAALELALTQKVALIQGRTIPLINISRSPRHRKEFFGTKDCDATLAIATKIL